MMRVSKFNTVVPKAGGGYIAYNAMTNALAVMDEDKKCILDQFHELGCDKIDPEFLSDLKRGGYIVDDNFDEMKYLKYIRAMRLTNRFMSLTIATTLNCNFACPYCYEGTDHTGSNMPEDVQDAIIKYVESNRPSTLDISWYGGEPLLAVDVIERLSEKLIAYCEEYNIKYNASIVTNGYYLNEENCRILKKYKVTGVQVTVDGTEDIHNKKRPLHNGGPTFQVIMENLAIASNYFPISLRINIDKENSQDGIKVLDIFHEKNLLDKVTPYLASIEDLHSEHKNDISLNKSVFVNLHEEFRQKAYDITGRDVYSPYYFYPSLRNYRCVSDNHLGLIIGSEGDLYKCWNHIGREEYCVGNIKTGKKLTNALFDYENPNDHMNEKPCSECRILPICMGGCVDRDIKSDKPQGSCPTLKYRMSEYLNDMAEYRQVQLQRK